MPRTYTQLTIKTLFGQASSCAYPNCEQPLVFTDRGVETVVAEIAHIRSEQPGGPRHDPAWLRDINGPDNLLLLCGQHHPPVDRHESVYPTAELLLWKEAQTATAGKGLPLSDSDLRSLSQLADVAVASLAEMARRVSRCIDAGQAVRNVINDTNAAQERERREAQAQVGPMWEISGDVSTHEVRGDATFQLSAARQREYQRLAETQTEPLVMQLAAALGSLREEVMVLEMMSDHAVGRAAWAVAAVAEGILMHLYSEDAAELSIQATRRHLAKLWTLANGAAD